MNNHKVADAHARNWSDKWLPKKFTPYFQLMRLDRPVGVWLLLWPCFWGQILGVYARHNQGFDINIWAQLHYIILFFVGAIIMRGAGCAYNDLVDYKYDKQVERTKSRPLPAGKITIKRAKYFLFYLLLAGFMVLIQFNWFTVFVGAASLILVATYPWMKRFTYWPQAFLGLAFNWGALLGFTAVTGYLSSGAIWLYVGGFFWTIGYDTIYAHQDKDDDMMIGLKSTAILFGKRTKLWLFILYALAMASFAFSLLSAGLGMISVLTLAPLSAHLIWQVMALKLDDADKCLKIFKSNILFGGLLTLGFLAVLIMIGFA